jgi:hypothetical protein
MPNMSMFVHKSEFEELKKTLKTHRSTTPELTRSQSAERASLNAQLLKSK